MASAVQQLFMIHRLRRHILQTPLSKIRQHREAFEELQKLFAFLQVGPKNDIVKNHWGDLFVCGLS